MLRIKKIGGVTLPDVGEENSVPVEIRAAYTNLGHGLYDQDRMAAVIAPTTITKRFIINNNVQYQLDQLMEYVGEGEKVIVAETRDGEKRQTFAKVTRVQAEIRSNDLMVWQPVVVEAQRSYGYWMSSEDEPPYGDNGVEGDNGLAGDGNYEEWDITSTNHVNTIANTGTADVAAGSIIIAPQSGATIANPKIYNARNGWWVRYIGTLNEDDYVIMYLLPQVITNNYANVYAAGTRPQIPDGQDGWMKLNKGDNDIEVSADNVTGTTKIYYRWSRHYL